MDKLAIINLPVVNELEQFKSMFDNALSGSNPLLNDALSYIKQRKGKMMRPMLTFLIAKLFGEVSKSTLYSAVALELLHTASLVHDDIVDESDERRGQPSVNAVYNNKVSVLVGDYLLATCLVQASLTENERIIEVIAKLGQELSEGEILQLSNVNNMDITEYVYFNVIRKKTAALFAACTTVGALSVSASKENITKARLFGEYVGICFQIRDDIFDYYDSGLIGKPTGNDMHEGKLTLPIIYALNKTHDAQAEEIAIKIKQSTASLEEINYLINFAKENGGIEYSKAKMDEYKRRAQKLLVDMPKSAIVDALNCYLDYVVDRNK